MVDKLHYSEFLHIVLTPSAVAIDDDDQVIVGLDAKEMLVSNENRSNAPHVISHYPLYLYVILNFENSSRFYLDERI